MDDGARRAWIKSYLRGDLGTIEDCPDPDVRDAIYWHLLGVPPEAGGFHAQKPSVVQAFLILRRMEMVLDKRMATRPTMRACR